MTLLSRVALTLMLATVPAMALARGHCEDPAIGNLERKTGAWIVARSRIALPPHFREPYGCAAISFVILADGHAGAARTVRFYPNRLYARAALAALTKFRFSTTAAGETGIVVFETGHEPSAAAASSE